MVEDGSEVSNLESFELCFENCDSVMIDPKAIKRLNFFLGETAVYLDAYRNRVHFDKSVDHVKIMLDISNSDFYTVSPNQSHITNPMERVVKSDDITRIYMNGIRYDVPYEPKQSYHGIAFEDLTAEMFQNRYQKNEIKGANFDMLMISIDSHMDENNE